jgi:3-dehydroquinate synthase
MNASLKVALGTRSYDIVIGSGLLSSAGGLIAPLLQSRRVIIITDDAVEKLYLKSLVRSLEQQGIRSDSITLPHGEQTKSFSGLEKLMDHLLGLAPDRKTALIALGGGVIGDICGFAASILLRGVDFIQVPTTLLAQVDSSVGGKTGINARQGKNLIGSFYQPKLVIADIATLATLPKRELLAGYAEAVKYGVIGDPAFFAWLEKNGEKAVAGNGAALAHIVQESCRKKAAIVAKDEHESGLRAILNFGHTLGHALEAETSYSTILLHGEAVAIGMMLAMRLSVMRKLSSENDYVSLKNHLTRVGLPSSPRDIKFKWNAENLIKHCYQDKKAKDGGLTFVLAKGIGRTEIYPDITEAELKQVLASEL